MKKTRIAAALCLLLLLLCAVPARAAGGGSFILTASTSSATLIAPVRVSYAEDETVAEALEHSGFSFDGLEQGYITAIGGVAGNFNRFYDGGKYDLTAPASEVTVFCFAEQAGYSENLLHLVARMVEYQEMDNNVGNYAPASAAYAAALKGIRAAGSDTAAALLGSLNTAISDYEAIWAGPKFAVTASASQGGAALENPALTLTDAYGNVTAGTGSVSVPAGSYQFSVSDGGCNRTDGTLTVDGAKTVTVTLPSGEWFGAIKLLDGSKEAYAGTQDAAAHTAEYQIPDTAGTIGSVYLSAARGAVPDAKTTVLRAVYVGTNQADLSDVSRSWESTASSLTYLVRTGMEGRVFRLEARYPGADGYTQIQSYTVTVTRVPTLRALTATADGTLLPLDFDPVTETYRLTTVSDTLTLAAEPFDSAYTVTETGTVASGICAVTVTAENGACRTYTLNVEKKDAVSVTLRVPDGTTAEVTNEAGAVIAPVGGVYRLIPGASYTCTATKNTYYHTAVAFTASEGQTITVTEPETADCLTALTLYDGTSAAYRKAYDSSAAFSAACHVYTYTVPDVNTMGYLQATAAGNTVTALYRAQTTAASSNGQARSVEIANAVSDSGAASSLGYLLTKSGCAQTVTVRVSHESGGVTYFQDYELLLARSEHLLSMSLQDGTDTLTLTDGSGAVCEFDRDRTAYKVKVNRDTESLTLNATFPNMLDATSCCGGYYALVNGTRYDTLSQAAVALDPVQDQETLTIQVCHADTRCVFTTYTVTVEKTDPIRLTVTTAPADAVLFLQNNQSGKRVLGENGVYALTPGGSYSYTVTCAGYVGQQVTDYIAPAADAALELTLEKAPESESLAQLSAAWPSFRADDDNNGVIAAKTPTSSDEAVLYWATKVGEGYDKDACGCPILVDGYVYTYAGTTLYKVDTVSGEIVATGAMDHASSFAINPPTYADGMLFVGLSGGTVEAFNASTLEALWIYTDPLGGQPNCPIVCQDGYVYTGFWQGETANANLVCLNATDENPSSATEQKLATWTYTQKGGFYWAGAYVSDNFLLVGTDDGASGYTTGKAQLLSLDPKTGVLLDAVTMTVPGDIRSSVVSDGNGGYYFTSKGGYFFKAAVNEDGTFPDNAIQSLKLYNYADEAANPAMSTSTPTVCNGRAYVGVSGTGQFTAYSGHNITVIDLATWDIAYTVRTQGYPQTSGILTTAYEAETGSVNVYFFDNFTPGKLRTLTDRPGQTAPSTTVVETTTVAGKTQSYDTASVLFTPAGEQAQYAICSPIVDEYGTIYFKNDSAYLMAVGSTIEKLEITQAPDKTVYRAGDTFDAAGMTVTATYTNGMTRDVTKYVTWSTEPLTEEDTDFTINFPYVMYQDKDGTAGTAYPEPFAVLALSVERVQYGDVSGDGKIKSQDALLVYGYCNGSVQLTEDQQRAADVSGDGKVTARDALLIYAYANGTLTEFPR
ncbi:MAG: dockerin type I domain-containing protein [Oscillospiraceae bacterium]|nr:dockerin type I domain-containing protein [Oscillospiraceae bacterium]